jgi:hypothetical protein
MIIKYYLECLESKKKYLYLDPDDDGFFGFLSMKSRGTFYRQKSVRTGWIFLRSVCYFFACDNDALELPNTILYYNVGIVL